MIAGLHTIWAYVDDMDRAVAFYRDVLGLAPGHVTPYWSDFAVGANRIGLHPRGAPTGQGGNWVLGLQCDDLKALRPKVEASGVSVVGYHETPSGVLLEFCDTEGNVVQALQSGSNMADFA